MELILIMRCSIISLIALWRYLTIKKW